jgi:hypothetical protein
MTLYAFLTVGALFAEAEEETEEAAEEETTEEETTEETKIAV